MKKVIMSGRRMLIMLFCLVFAACDKGYEGGLPSPTEEPPAESASPLPTEAAVQENFSQSIDQNGLTKEQLENALPLVGKAFGELPVVGEEDEIYCNLPENIRDWDTFIPICHDPLYDILYYVDCNGDNMIHAIKDGKSELVIELPGKRLFCRGGKLYFLLDSKNLVVNGAQSGNILSYDPVGGKVEVVCDGRFDSIVVYQDLIYCKKDGDVTYFSNGGFMQVDYWFFLFDSKMLVSQEQKFLVQRWGDYFLANIYMPYDRSDPDDFYEQQIAEGRDPDTIGILAGRQLCRWNGSETIPLEGVEYSGWQLPYIKGDDIMWFEKDGIHTWNIPAGQGTVTEIELTSTSTAFLLDGKVYGAQGYADLATGISGHCFTTTWESFNSTYGRFGLLEEIYTDGREIYGLNRDSNAFFRGLFHLWAGNIEEAIAIADFEEEYMEHVHRLHFEGEGGIYLIIPMDEIGKAQ